METPRENSEDERNFSPNPQESAEEPTPDDSVNPEDRMETVERRADREISDLTEATSREIARLSLGDFAKFMDRLADKPEVREHLKGVLEAYSSLSDDEAATEAIRSTRDKAKGYLEGPV